MTVQRVEFRMPGPKVVKLVVLGSPSPPHTDMRKVVSGVGVSLSPLTV